jgi:hypothetical protein
MIREHSDRIRQTAVALLALGCPVLACTALVGVTDIHFQDDGGLQEAGGPLPEVLQTNQPVMAIAVADGTIYFTEAVSGAAGVFRMGTNGTDLQRIAQGDRPGPIVADGTYVYWAELGDGGASGTINRAAHDGGSAVVLATGQTDPEYMAVNSTYVYWTVGLPDAGVYAVPVDATADNLPAPTAVGTAAFSVLAVAASDDDVVWSVDTQAASEINDQPLDGGAPAGGAADIVPSARFGPGALALHGIDVYFNDGSSMMHVGTANSGVPSQPIAELGGPINGMAADGTALYWLAQDPILQVQTCDVPMCLQGPKTLGHLDSNGSWLVIDAQNVYWLDASGHIRKLAR